MGGASRLTMRVGIGAIAVVLGLAACGKSGSPTPSTPAAPTTPPAPPETPRTAGAAAQAPVTVPVKGGKTTTDLGIGTKGGTFTPLIERGSVLPAKRTEIFTTAEDNQATIRIDVYRGVSDRAADNQRVGGYELTVPNPGPKGVPQLSATFAVDASGAFRLTVTDDATGGPVTVSSMD